MPGVSIITAPAEMKCMERAVVVCLPLLSSLLMSAVFCPALPISELTNVDLPTPEEPTTAKVLPNLHHCSSELMQLLSSALTTSNRSMGSKSFT